MKNCFVMLLSAEVVKQVSRLSPSSSVSTRGPMVRIIPRCTMSKALNNTALRMCSKFKQNCVIVAQSRGRTQQAIESLRTVQQCLSSAAHGHWPMSGKWVAVRACSNRLIRSHLESLRPCRPNPCSPDRPGRLLHLLTPLQLLGRLHCW